MIKKINLLLDKKVDIFEFEKIYYFYFLEYGGEIEDENNFFADVQEKLDWTDPNPDEESRKYGWINHKEYVEWLRERKKQWEDSNKK